MNIKPLLLSATLALTAQMTSMNVHAEILSIGPNAKVLKKSNMPRFGQTMKKVTADSDRDYWMKADEAKAYGMIDEILVRK